MTAPGQIAYDQAPLQAFHLRVAAASFGGVFCDGFGLGTIGLVLELATTELQLTPQWLGLLGGAALLGLFFGALSTGPFIDRFGRRPVFACNMVILSVLSALQFFSASGAQLLALRLAIGFMLGTDYVVSKTLLTEFTPTALRGRLMSTLSVAWAGGYACAYFVCYALSSMHADAWRWMLASSAVPCLLMIPLRLTLPESPLWQAAAGRNDEAAQTVRRCLGPRVATPVAAPAGDLQRARWSMLFSDRWRRRSLVACVFFTAQTIPYFAVGTFVARIIKALHVQRGFAGGVLYNASLLLGAIVGLIIIDRLSRRAFLVGSYTLSAVTLLLLTVSDRPDPLVTIGLFAVFAGVLSSSSNLVYVYLPELFPTGLRGSGIGLAIASSRIGSAVSTFLLPVIVSEWGAHIALALCAAVLLAGAAVCYRWAPETRGVPLAATLA
jgi:MFS transporter, putative metabolite transport protein